MRLNFLFCTISAALLCSCVQASETQSPHELLYRPEEKFTEFKGVGVRNLQNEKLGTVKDITVDLQNARLVDVIVASRGGFLGFGSKLMAVAPRALKLDAANHVLRLDMSKSAFAGAPRFNSFDMVAEAKEDRIAEVDRYYGFKPWFFDEDQAGGKNEEILHLGPVERTTRIIGLPVVNTRGDFLGRVGTVTMDLPKGQIVHIILVTEAVESPRSVVQARALRFNEKRSALVLDDSLADLAGKPHFKWRHINQSSFQQEMYVNRDVKADSGLHSRQNAREGIVEAATTMKQGQSFRDEQQTNRILQEIQADSSLSRNAKNVEVVTLNGQTTLRGHVNTAEGKRKIGEIAAKAGRPENVSNQLVVRPNYAAP